MTSKQLMIQEDVCNQLTELKKSYNLRSYTKVIELLLEAQHLLVATRSLNSAVTYDWLQQTLKEENKKANAK